ncbi:UNVERIFIED_CONTAM: putative membrane-associated kinase regulator 4 [Sesamum radiatum]|uniref:Membrane-associated kinase regulator 4 n=1 Tax=Sesamum radiatum TaxID=300843 RepID=A0AAW2NMW7_SESRA
MATNLASYASADEDYIDMELSPSFPPATDFEFQMSFTSNEQETTTSPADDLFYKGKLLPLHLPRRLRMILCDVSPSESCRVSSELNPDDNFFEWSSELSSFIKSYPTNKSWSKKLKLIKHTILAQKLKASRAYLKSLFSKSVCSNELCTKADCNAVAPNLSKAEAYISSSVQ